MLSLCTPASLTLTLGISISVLYFSPKVNFDAASKSCVVNFSFEKQLLAKQSPACLGRRGLGHSRLPERKPDCTATEIALIYLNKRCLYVILLVIWQEHSIFMERNKSLFEQQVVEALKNDCVPRAGNQLLPWKEHSRAGEKTTVPPLLPRFSNRVCAAYSIGTSPTMNTDCTGGYLSNTSRPFIIYRRFISSD